MTRKTRNSVILYSIALVVLAVITVSVWLDTEKALKKKKPDADVGSASPDPSLGVTVALTFGPGVSSRIRASEMPELTATVKNTSLNDIRIHTASVMLKKCDFIDAGGPVPVSARTSHVFPRRIGGTREGTGSLTVKPGTSRMLTYRIGDYFDIYPGTFDIEWIMLTGGVWSGSMANTKEIRAVKRVKVAEGIMCARCFSGEGVPMRKKAAEVNGKPIFEDTFITELKAEYGYSMLQKLIAEKCVWEALLENGVKVTRDDIDYAVEFEKRAMEEKLDGVPFEKYLESKGLSEKELRESRGFLLRIAIRKFLSRRDAHKPSAGELISYFDRKYSWYGREEMVQARKIVVKPEKKGELSPHYREEAIKRLLTIKEEIERGNISFKKAVDLYSQDVRAKVSGGVMDPFRRYSDARENDVPKTVAEVGFRLEPGKISTPIETDEGFMILQVVKRIPAKKVLFEDVRDVVEKDYLYDMVTGDDIQQWIRGLIDNARITRASGLFEQFGHLGRPRKLKHYETDLIEED